MVPLTLVSFVLHAHAISNPGGVRFGSAELYDVIDMCFAPDATHHAHTVVDCLVVGQSIARGTDERVVLFVKLLEGETLTEELEKRIKQEIRTRRSARHVPAKVRLPVSQGPWPVKACLQQGSLRLLDYGHWVAESVQCFAQYS